MKDYNTSSSSSSGGIGFIGALQIVFIVLKLLDKIDWSWVWVLAPLWISTAIVIGVLAIIFIGIVIKSLIDTKKGR